MKTYKLRWTEEIVWETEVKAENEQDAMNKISEDEAQENAEHIKTLNEFQNVEAEEVRE